MRTSSRVGLSLLTALLLFGAARSASAAVTPLSLSILAPVQFPPEDFTVAGARVSLLWGKHRNVYGLDLGVLGNRTTGNMTGIGVAGLFNLNHGTTTIIGLQAAGLTNINVNKAKIVGVQVAAGLNSNQAESTLVGLQIALGNHSPFTDIWGAQVGIYNRAEEVRGIQIGLVNVAKALHGIQIGLINFNRTGLISVAPILNIGF